VNATDRREPSTVPSFVKCMAYRYPKYKHNLKKKTQCQFSLNIYRLCASIFRKQQLTFDNIQKYAH